MVIYKSIPFKSKVRNAWFSGLVKTRIRMIVGLFDIFR